MHTNLRRGLLGTLFAGGLLALGTSAAYAADTTGSDGLASGTQVIAPVTAPVTLGAMSIGLLGDSAASTHGTTGASPSDGTEGDNADGNTTSGEEGIASGTQVIAPVTAPVTLGATSVGLLGDSAASTDGTASGTTAPAPSDGTEGDNPGGNTTSGSDGLASGTQITAPVNAPVTLGATSIGLLGDSTAYTDGTARGTTAPAPSDGTEGESNGGTSAPAPSEGTEESNSGNVTSGEEGTASGAQVTAPVTAPVTLSATSIGLLGDSTASAEAPAEPGTEDPATPSGGHSDGVVGGSASGPGAAAGAQCAAQTVGFVATGLTGQLKAPGTGTDTSAVNSGVQFAALALLCGSALLKLRRRSA